MNAAEKQTHEMIVDGELEGHLERVSALMKAVAATRAKIGMGDVAANVTLAIRHLEDAQSRLERAWVTVGSAADGKKETHNPALN